MTTQEKITLMAVLVALVTSITTGIFAWINFKRENLNQKIQYANLKQQYFISLRTWADQLCDLLSEAAHFSELDPARCPDGSFFERRNKIRTSLSSIIDRGKWFFPNLKSEKKSDRRKKKRIEAIGKKF